LTVGDRVGGGRLTLGPLDGRFSTVVSLANGGHMRRFFTVLLVVFFAALSFVSLVTVVQAQAPSLAVPHNITMMASHEPITVTVSVKDSHESVTPTVMASNSFTMPAHLKLIGSVFALETSDTANTQRIIIKVRYTPPEQIDEKRLILAYYDTLAEKWLPLDTTIEAVNHVATAEVMAQDAVYALVVSPAAATMPSNAVMVDDSDTTHFVRYGALAGWHDVTGPTNHYYLGHMYWTSNTFSVLDNYALWTPALSPGPYQVYAFIDWDNATTQNARYQIVHNGQTTIYPVNQNIHYAEWVSLGIYDFGSEAGSNYVQLEDVTGETYSSKRVGFDAIAFVPNKVYLPLVLKSEPVRIKAKTGIH
jgi:hypothetical protein